MTSLKHNFYNFCGVVLLQLTGHSGELAWAGGATDIEQSRSTLQRFIKFDSAGKPLENPGSREVNWSCILDRKTGLLWEIKSNDGLLRDSQHTFSWYEPDAKRNGGFSGYRNKGRCSLAQCNTHAYIAAINQKHLCGNTDWRLPTREELRSIVDYQIRYPGPTINTNLFPNTVSQFYWSSDPDASDKDSAWGIGFSFGYDYAYFKSDLGYVRLVSGYQR